MTAPLALDVNATGRRAAGADPFPLVPAAYNCTDAPAIGLIPACDVTWNEGPANVTGAAPVPVRLTVCVPAEVLFGTDSVPVRVPVAVGLKVTKIWQLALGARLAAHPPLVWVKSPLTAMEERFRANDPRLVAVIICGALDIPVVIVPNVRAVAERERMGTAAVAVPLSAMLCVPLGLLVVMVSDPVRVPVAVGLKITRIWQVVLAARFPMHPKLCCEKSPVVAIVEIVTAALELFVTVTVCAGLESPLIVLGNARDVGDRLSTVAVPVPVSDTVCGLPVPLLVRVNVPVLVPKAVGVKVTEIVHVALTAILAEHAEFV